MLKGIFSLSLYYVLCLFHLFLYVEWLNNLTNIYNNVFFINDLCIYAAAVNPPQIEWHFFFYLFTFRRRLSLFPSFCGFTSITHK